MNTSTFFRLLDSDDKGAELAHAIKSLAEGCSTPIVHLVEPSLFGVVQGSPLAYWVSDAIRDLFKSLPRFATEGRAVRQGMATADDFRFVRTTWEIPAALRLRATYENWRDAAAFQLWCLAQSQEEVRWFTFTKGGEYLPFYADLSLVGNWHRGGCELAEFSGSVIRNSAYYFQAGYTYPLRTSRLCPQVMPAGSLISVRGSGIYGEDTGKYLALLGSRPFDYLIKMMLGWASRPQFDMGDINATPVPEISESDGRLLASFALQYVCAKRELDITAESTHAFVRPSAALNLGDTLANCADDMKQRVQATTIKVASFQAEIDEIAFRLYNINCNDRKAIEADDNAGTFEESRVETEGGASDVDSGKGVTVVEQLVSYAFGLTFGRWDIRYATGEKASPELPDPFAPLPVCPPGQLQNEQGLPAGPGDVPEGYPVPIPWDGILVDDPNHPADIVARSRQVMELIWQDKAADIEHEAAEILGVRELRDYFRKSAAGGFWPDHIKRYSKSRRKAPIYWQLATGSGSYSVLLYYHRFTSDTFFKILNEYARPKLAHERQKLDRLKGEFGAQPTRSQQKELETQESLIAELAEFTEEIQRVAPLWRPNLNDGVIINFAPLWRLVPQNKPWQKECKACWDSLVKGEYDWSHLAMHLWPERVVPKCQTDASLAIAHGLENEFWQKDARDRYQPKPAPECGWEVVVKKLVAERQSPAVKASVESLMEAPVSQSGGKGGRKRKGTA